MQIKDRFYKLVALGLGTAYGFQVFVTIGGVTRFIPSTGVTLPLKRSEAYAAHTPDGSPIIRSRPLSIHMAVVHILCTVDMS